jgi:transcriptional/translational regulatory protein YebC/TACO1
MAGQSKWAKVKRLKAVADAKRGKIFLKLARKISGAAVNKLIEAPEEHDDVKEVFSNFKILRGMKAPARI